MTIHDRCELTQTSGVDNRFISANGFHCRRTRMTSDDSQTKDYTNLQRSMNIHEHLPRPILMLVH